MYNTPGQPLSEALNGMEVSSYTTKGSSIVGDIAERVGLQVTADKGGPVAATPMADPSPASLVTAKPLSPNTFG